MPLQFIKLQPWVVFHCCEWTRVFIRSSFGDHLVCLALLCYSSATVKILLLLSCARLPPGLGYVPEEDQLG